jgi:methionyl-tRNA synthetase
MLHATGEYIVPDNVPANEFMNLEGDKMSTSRGWSIEMHEYLQDFPDKPDVLRYALLTNLPEAKDSEFTWKDFQAKNNNELVAIFGNFVNRAFVLTQKFFDNKVPVLGELQEIDKKALADLKLFPTRISDSIETYRFREATANLMDLARLGNKYLAETEPWKLAKTDLPRVGTILNIALQIAANLSVMAEPFLPFSANKLKAMLNFGTTQWHQAGEGDLLKAGHPLGESALLFEKIEDEVIEVQIKKLFDTKKKMELESQPATPAKPEVSFDEFSKMDIRIGKILKAERVEKSKKLLKLQVDTGIDTRTVMSGIAEHFAPEDIIGKQVTILVNLAPRKIMGVESQGMILMASDKDGSLKLLSPGSETSSGSVIS